MIQGLHFLLYSTDADADRAFLKDVLGWKHVDVGGGWLIFKAPQSEIAVHPGEAEDAISHAERNLAACTLYLMCDDLEATMAMFRQHGRECTEISEQPWGRRTTVVLPSGAELGLYQPRHQTALDL